MSKEHIAGTDIRPCPFCGSTNIGVQDIILDHHTNEKDAPCSSTRKVWAYCRYCGAQGSTRTGDFVNDDEIIAMAYERWNRRAIESVSLSELEKEIIDRINRPKETPSFGLSISDIIHRVFEEHRGEI